MSLQTEVDLPKVGSVRRHYKGGRYRVVAVAKLEAKPEAGFQVVYRLDSEDQAPTWVRPLAEWNELLDAPVAGVIPRFRKI